MLAEQTIALSDKYEDEKNKNELTIEELESFMTWDVDIKMRNNIPDTVIYEKLILFLYTYFPLRRIKDYYQMYYTCVTSEEMIEEDKQKNYITSYSKFIFNTYKTAKLYKSKVFDCQIGIFSVN